MKIVTPYVPTGANVFEIESAADYLIGDSILVVRTPNDKWIDTLEMAQFFSPVPIYFSL